MELSCPLLLVLQSGIPCACVVCWHCVVLGSSTGVPYGTAQSPVTSRGVKERCSVKTHHTVRHALGLVCLRLPTPLVAPPFDVTSRPVLTFSAHSPRFSANTTRRQSIDRSLPSFPLPGGEAHFAMLHCSCIACVCIAMRMPRPMLPPPYQRSNNVHTLSYGRIPWGMPPLNTHKKHNLARDEHVRYPEWPCPYSRVCLAVHAALGRCAMLLS